ncbi:MAG: cyclic nucleotide-binding domain-containing protein, partial [Haliea sp.]
MNTSLRTPRQFDLQGLVQAVSQNHSHEGLTLTLTPAQWDLMAGYLHPLTVAQGQVLIEQGAQDRT